MNTPHFNLRVLFAASCCLAASVRSSAAQPPAPPLKTYVQIPTGPPRQLEHNGLMALIAAPTEVCLHQSRSFPVIIRVSSLDYRKLPDRVTLRAFGKIESGGESGDGVLDIKLQNGLATAIISFPNLTWPGKEPLPIEVTTVGEPAGFIGSTSVRLRHQASIDLVEAPVSLVADGKFTAPISAIIKDQLGRPLEGVPVILRYVLPGKKRQFVALWTDARGIVTYTTPPGSQPGASSFQFEAEQGVSSQLLCTYQTPVTEGAKNNIEKP